MASVDIDMTLPIDEIQEPVIITLSIDEVRQFLRTQTMPYDVEPDLQAFIEEYDAGAHH